MDYRIQPDSIGRPIIHGTNERGEYVLNVDFVLYKHTDGRAYTINDSGGRPTNLSPVEAEMLEWYSAKHPRCKPCIFAGEPNG